MRLQDLSALVVHLRPYRESSAMVQFFTREQGRLVGVMRGFNSKRRPQHVQPFQLGTLSCTGKSGLVTVTGFEVSERLDLSGDALSAGFYVLELISRGLAERQAEPGVFDATIKVLKTLVVGAAMAPCLRQFELEFLAQLGYGLDFHHDSVSGESINPTGSYYLVEDQGFVAVDPNLTGQSSAQSLSIPGWILLAIAAGDFRDAQVRQVAKRVNQNALTPLIGSEPLISRSMYTGESRG